MVFDVEVPWNYPKEKNRDKRRKFTRSQEKEIWDRQHGYCHKCEKKLRQTATHYHHIKPWSQGGKTIINNGQALCTDCHNRETNKNIVKKVELKSRTKASKNQFPLDPFNYI